MIITIYSSQFTLYQGDYVAAEWVYYRFRERPPLAERTDNGFIKVHSPLRAISVSAHVGVISEDGKSCRIADGKSYCAWHVLLFAERGKKGMRVIR
jgi:hypothetical protein